MQKTICALQRAVCRCRSRIHSEAGIGSSCCAMTQHYPTTSATVDVWTSGRSFSAPAMLLIYAYMHSLSKTLLFVLCLSQTWDKERCGSSRWLSNLQPCIADVSKVNSLNFGSRRPPRHRPFHLGHVPRLAPASRRPDDSQAMDNPRYILVWCYKDVHVKRDPGPWISGDVPTDPRSRTV